MLHSLLGISKHHYDELSGEGYRRQPLPRNDFVVLSFFVATTPEKGRQTANDTASFSTTGFFF